jgi:hypothetical protein
MKALSHLFLVAHIVGAGFLAPAHAADPPGKPLLLAATNSIEDLLTHETDYPPSGVILGQGWSSYLGQKTQAVCVTGVEKPIGTNTNFVSYHDVFDREQLSSLLDISAKMSYGSFSGRAQFSRSVAIDKSQRTILAKVRVGWGGSSLAPELVAGKDSFPQIRLTDRVLAMLNDKAVIDKVAAFVAMCGDGYVSSIAVGGELDVVFNLQLEDKDVEESYSARAKGSFGAGGGSMSAAYAVKNTSESKVLSFTKTSSAGPLFEGAPSVKSTVEYIERFTRMPAESARPMSVSIDSYRNVSNWPAELSDVGLTAKAASLLAGQAWRFRDLGQVYSEAAMDPSAFYFPFSKGDKPLAWQTEAAERSSALFGAADCLAALDAVCSKKGNCDINQIFSPANLPRVCPAMLAKTNTSVYMAGLLGTDGMKVVPASGPQKLDMLKAFNSLGKVELPKQPEAVENQVTPVEAYYFLLAESPLRRSMKEGAGDTRTADDETKRVEIFAKTRSREALVAYANLAGPTPKAPNEEGAREMYRAWVLNARLAPLSTAFCAIGAHPMCLPTPSLLNITQKLKPEFGDKRNFTATLPLPVPAAPAVMVVTPPEKPGFVRCGGSKSCGRTDM